MFRTGGIGMSHAADKGGDGNVIGGKVLRLGWAATCVDCGRALAPGERAWWFHLGDVGHCMTCAESPVPESPVDVGATPAKEPAPPTQPTRPVPPTQPSLGTEPRPVEGPATQTRPATSAGASAQTEYERRRSKDKARIRQNLPRLLLVVVAAPIVGYFGVRIGADIIDGLFRSVVSSAIEGGVDNEPMFDSGLVHLVGLCAAFALTVTAAASAFGARQSTEAWRIGAEGERLTGRALQKLPASYRVLHDLSMPRSKANIDHVVAGPTGVFTVETKNYKNGVTIKGGRVYGSGRNLDGVVRQARRQASAVAERTGATVTPIVCVHGGGVRLEGRFQKPVVDGVRFCSGRQLLKTVAGCPVELGDDAIQEVERRLA